MMVWKHNCQWPTKMLAALQPMVATAARHVTTCIHLPPSVLAVPKFLQIFLGVSHVSLRWLGITGDPPQSPLAYFVRTPHDGPRPISSMTLSIDASWDQATDLACELVLECCASIHLYRRCHRWVVAVRKIHAYTQAKQNKQTHHYIIPPTHKHTYSHAYTHKSFLPKSFIPEDTSTHTPSHLCIDACIHNINA